MRHFVAILAAVFVLAMVGGAGAQPGASPPGDPLCVKGSQQKAGVYEPECSPYALGRYTGNRCYVTIDRNAPVSPQTITVPRGTMVCVVLTNPRPTESVQFVPSFADVAAPDFASGVLQNLSPLQSVGFAAGLVLPSPSHEADATFFQKIDERLKTLGETLATDQQAIVDASTAANCFAQYSRNAINPKSFIQFDKETPSGSRQVTLCNTQWLEDQGDDLKKDLQAIYTQVQSAANMALPQGEISQLTTIITDGLKVCAQTVEPNNPTPPATRPSSDQCKDLSALNDRLANLQAIETSLATAQANLQQVELQMETLPAIMATLFYKLPTDGQRQKGYTSGTVSIMTQPLVATSSTPSPTTVATVPITFGADRWLTFTTSTGTAFMLGRAANYSLQQQATASSSSSGTLCSGVVQGPSGPTSTYCVVNSPSSSPQVLVPVVYVHYLLFGVQKSPFQIGFHLTGGAGLNVSPANKSAAFLAGASLQLGSVMITPAVSFFEDQRLGGGYNIGQLYTSGGSLPTSIVWPRKFSIGISYVIPLLSSASPASPSSSPSPNSSNSSGNQSSSGGGGGSPKKSH